MLAFLLMFSHLSNGNVSLTASQERSVESGAWENSRAKGRVKPGSTREMRGGGRGGGELLVSGVD